MEWSEMASQNTSKPSLYLVAVEGLSGGVGLAGALVRPDIKGLPPWFLLQENLVLVSVYVYILLWCIMSGLFLLSIAMVIMNSDYIHKQM